MQKEELLLVVETATLTLPPVTERIRNDPKDVILVEMNKHLLPNVFTILKTSHTGYEQL